MDSSIYRNNRPLIGRSVNATYRESNNILYRHNCFIEALPERWDILALHKIMVREPVYDEAVERGKAPLDRLDALEALSKCVFLMPDIVTIEQKISSAIRNGYCERNPLAAEWTKQLNCAFENFDNESCAPLMRSTSNGFAIIGTSGVGKSLMVESVLGAYPQVIVHERYNETLFMRKQLVWLKLDCPDDATLSGLCVNFFDAVDNILGTSYVENLGIAKNRLPNIAVMQRHMCSIAANLGLGVLVIDEIQRLICRKENDPKGLLNFFERLTNTFGVPVLLMGTPKAFKLFSGELAKARRIAGHGEIVIKNLAQDDVWDRFIKKLWKYQYTKTPTPLSKSLNNAMYEESQGIVDFAVKLYKLAQGQVIGQADETITPHLIRDVGGKFFNSAKPILTALRTNDITALGNLDDVRIDRTMLDNLFKLSQKRITLLGSINTIENQQKASVAAREDMLESPIGQIATMLVQAGFSRDIALKSASQSVGRFASDADLKNASVEAFRIAGSLTAQENEAQHQIRKTRHSPRVAKTSPAAGDLRIIYENAQKNKRTMYDELNEAGYIKSLTDFMEQRHV